MKLPLPPSPLRVFAVEDTEAQISWGKLEAGRIKVEGGQLPTEFKHNGGPGSHTIEGLLPDTTQTVSISDNNGTRKDLAITTLPAPPGPETFRFATISDLHLGATKWGFLHTMNDIDESSNHAFPMRCARAAIAEAVDWGAQLLLIKGDALHHLDSEAVELLSQLVDKFAELPMLLIPGNHDVDELGDLEELPESVGQRQLKFETEVGVKDVAGLRIIYANSTIPSKGKGRLSGIGEQIIEAAGGTSRPIFLAMHHQLQPYRWPTYWPMGIGGSEAKPFLQRLTAANKAAFVTAGHTHRNRARKANTTPITEVASTRDWPGVWAGYAVHEGGIRQVVRKVAAPEAGQWHEYSRNAVVGIWDRWSPGQLGDRCLTHTWPS